MNKLQGHFNRAKATLRPSLEGVADVLGFVGAIILTGAFVGIVGSGVAAAFNWLDGKAKGAINKQKPGQKQVTPAQTIELIQKTYLNPQWLEKQTSVEGEVSGVGIVHALAVGKGMPSDPGKAAQVHVQTVLTFLSRFFPKFDAYRKRIHPIFDHMLSMQDTMAAEQYGQAQLKGVKHLGGQLGYSEKGLLGNPEVEVQRNEYSIDFVGVPGWGNPKIKPLTKEQIPAVATALIKCLENAERLHQYQREFWKIYDYEDNRFDVNNGDLWQDLISSGVDDYVSHNFHQDNWRQFVTDMIESVSDVAKALEGLLEVSLVKQKGKASVSQEGWFGGSSDGTPRMVKRILDDLQDNDDIKFSPYGEEGVKRFEEATGVRLDDSTSALFEKVGKIFCQNVSDECDGATVQELIDAHKRVVKQFPELAKFVPYIYWYGYGWVGIDLADKKIKAVFQEVDGDGSEDGIEDWGRKELADIVYYEVGDVVWR